jgi:hypothetical protein
MACAGAGGRIFFGAMLTDSRNPPMSAVIKAGCGIR